MVLFKPRSAIQEKGGTVVLFSVLSLLAVITAHVIVARMCIRAIRSLEDELVKLIQTHRKLCRVSGYSRKKGKTKTAVKNFWESLLRLLLS